MLLLAPLAGAVVDRIGPRRVMVTADVARMVLAALLPLLAGSPAAIYAVAFGMSAAAVFFNPAAGAVLPVLVGDDELVSVNSGIWTAAVLSQIVLAAGVLVATAGYTPAFLINAVSFAVSALFLLGLRIPRPPRGRVFAGFDLTWQLGRLMSLALGGITADLLGLPAVYAGGAVLLAFAVVIGWTVAGMPDQEQDGLVKVQLLVVEDCPNEGRAAAVLRRALDEVGLPAVPVTIRVVTSQAEAEQLGFLGSPSFLIDGSDPFAAPHHRPAMACRLYRDGPGLSGVPPIGRLRQALKQAADITATKPLQ
ncbi:MFS transporter [Micromonospora sp. 4G55]|uniref:MFS transporter n=1 Tax=Micromonospora sp. 4G55 TaxID=2806102 RepID=UPI001A381376|nr:MFS transporter [Micromonospora sp. 4G55]MBM0255629.1 MFS transporter [Micromonospora sp. 4G55]